MSFNLGDKVYWEDYDQPNLSLKGKVTKMIGDNIVIYWENGRKTQYTPEQLEYGALHAGKVKLDVQSIRLDKLEILGI